MPNVVLAYRERTLNGIVNELESSHPKVGRFRATTYGEDIAHILQQKPAVVLVDANVEKGLGICEYVKTNPQLGKTHTIYFARDKKETYPQNPNVNQWYLKGAYNPRVVVRSVQHILN